MGRSVSLLRPTSLEDGTPPSVGLTAAATYGFSEALALIRPERREISTTSGVTSLKQSSVGHAVVQRKHHFTKTLLMPERKIR
jgi:hypothetical protein